MIDIIAWVDITGGVVIGAVSLIKLTAARTQPKMAEVGARRSAWSNLLICLLAVLVGIAVLGSAAKNETAEWVARLAICAVVGLMIFQWLRSRLQGKAD
jgi:hypothetical protein